MSSNQLLNRNEVVRINNGGFTLSLAGLAVQLVSAAIIGTMFFLAPTFFGYGTCMPFGGMMGGYCDAKFGPGYSMFGSNELGVAYIVFWLISIALVGVLGISGLVLMRSSSRTRIVTGSIVMIIAAALAFPTMWGFGLGSIFMVAGGVISALNIL